MDIIMAHPSFPWQDEALSIATHKPRVYIDLSGWSPKYFSPQLVQYAGSLLRHKVLFGTDFPVMTPERWIQDFENLSIKPERVGEVLPARTAVDDEVGASGRASGPRPDPGRPWPARREPARALQGPAYNYCRASRRPSACSHPRSRPPSGQGLTTRLNVPPNALIPLPLPTGAGMPFGSSAICSWLNRYSGWPAQDTCCRFPGMPRPPI